MNEFFALLGDTLIAISGLLIVIACGAVMHRLHILTDTILNALSKVLVYLMVPILLFSCMIQFDNLSEILKTNWIFTVSVALIVAFGFSVSKFSGQLFGVRQRTRSSVMCATALPNGGYIPLALNVMLCSVFPQFLNMENKGISMVAMGMMVFIPSIWIVGYGLLTATSFELRNWRKILTPPIWGMIAGIVLGLLFESVHAHRFFLMKGSLLHPLYLGIKMIADCTIPCALLILGGKLAVRRPPGFIQKRAVYMTVFLRLLVIPSAVLAVVTLLWRLDFLPQDPFIPLMIVLIAAMPPSNDLVVIASANHKTEGLIANLTFWCYLCSILTIPVFISLAMRIFSS